LKVCRAGAVDATRKLGSIAAPIRALFPGARGRDGPALEMKSGIAERWARPSGPRPGGRGRSGWVCGTLLPVGEESIDEAGESGAGERGEPEEPELFEGPALDEERRTGAAGRVDGEVRDGDSD